MAAPTGLVRRWVTWVGGGASPRGAEPFQEVTFEWFSERSSAEISEAVKAAITPWKRRMQTALSASLLLRWDARTVTGHANDVGFSLRAASGLDTPWRQRIDGYLRPSEGRTRVVANMRPSRLAALYFSVGLGALCLTSVGLLVAGLVLAPWRGHTAGELIVYALTPVPFAALVFVLGRVSCRIGLRQADAILSVLDDATATSGTPLAGT
jgi:hypothetical protein